MNLRLLRQSVLIAFSLLAAGSAPAWADGDDALAALGLAPATTQQSVPSARTPRPASKIAENVTVITADDISRINAHTLADILQTVPGIQVEFARTPGGYSFFNIQGAVSTQVLVLVDGIPFNELNEQKVLPNEIPVQQIERIEIIKGAASASWGPALGGVINIITKSPDPERSAGGMVSGSVGEWNTTDARGELSGTIKRFGYYLSGGNLHSDGMNPNTSVNQKTFAGKLAYALPGKGLLSLGYSQFDVERGLEHVVHPVIAYYDSDARRQHYGYLRLNQPLAERLHLELTGYTARKHLDTYLGDLINGEVIPWRTWQAREQRRGVSGRLTWGDSWNNLVTGFEIERAATETRNILTTDPPTVDKEWTKWAVHANGTLTIGSLTILPGIRYDHTGLTGSYLSYTLGATYQLTDKTVLRAYGARGYSLPNAQFQHDNLSTTRTFQAGIETSEIPYLWLKGTFFHNRLDDVEQTNNNPALFNQTKQGFELEGRTVPWYGLSLTGGYTFLDAKDRDTHERLQTTGGQSVPRQSLKLGLNYDQKELGLRGALAGNYVWWNAAQSFDIQGRYSAMVWDLHLNWQLFPHRESSPELFFSIRNLLNGDQSLDYLKYPNTPRWIEGGVRFKF